MASNWSKDINFTVVVPTAILMKMDLVLLQRISSRLSSTSSQPPRYDWSILLFHAAITLNLPLEQWNPRHRSQISTLSRQCGIVGLCEGVRDMLPAQSPACGQNID